MKIIILTLSPAREAFEWRSLLDVWEVDLPLTSVRVCLFDTMRFYLCLMSQTLLSLESASIKFNPNKLCCTIFLPSPAIQIENRRRSCPANLKCLFKRGCACVCARVHVCVLMNDSLGQDHKYPCWTAAIAFFFFFVGEVWSLFPRPSNCFPMGIFSINQSAVREKNDCSLLLT